MKKRQFSFERILLFLGIVLVLLMNTSCGVFLDFADTMSGNSKVKGGVDEVGTWESCEPGGTYYVNQCVRRERVTTARYDKKWNTVYDHREGGCIEYKTVYFSEKAEPNCIPVGSTVNRKYVPGEVYGKKYISKN